MAGKPISRTGVRIAHQTCLGDTGMRRRRSAVLLWLCDCGNTFQREYHDALKTKSCGECRYWRESMSESAKRRGVLIHGNYWTPASAGVPDHGARVVVRNGAREWETSWKSGLMTMADYGIKPITHWRRA